MREARIYRPTKNAMQSGKRNTRRWVLEILPEDSRYVDSIMGWTGSSDTTQQLRLKFDSQKEAEDYAKRKGLHYRVIEPKTATIKIQAYADNFI